MVAQAVGSIIALLLHAQDNKCNDVLTAYTTKQACLRIACSLKLSTLTIVCGHLLNVAIALGSLSLIKQGQDEIQLVVLKPLLEGHSQFQHS